MLGVTAGDGDGEGVAGLDVFGVVREGRTGQDALGFVADVEEYLVGGEGDDDALKLALAGLLGFVRVAALKGVEQVGKGLFGLFGGRLSGGGLFGAGLWHGLGRRGRTGSSFGGRLRDGLGDWRRSDFGGGQGFFLVFVGHDSVLIHSPMIGRGKVWSVLDTLNELWKIAQRTK